MTEMNSLRFNYYKCISFYHLKHIIMQSISHDCIQIHIYIRNNNYNELERIRFQ